MKKILSLFLAVLFVLSFAGCSGSTEDNSQEKTLKIFTLQGPTGMGMAKLIWDSQDKKSDIDYEISVAGSADEFKGDIIQGNFDIACVPANLAAVLYQKNEGKIIVAAINTLGVLYILENGNTVNSLSDLEGKTVYMAGQGNVPEYALRYLTDTLNIKCDTVFEPEHDAVVSDLLSGKADIVLLPEPKVSAVMNNPNVPAGVRIAVDIEKEWKNAVSDDSDLCMGCVIVNRNTAEKYPELTDKFLEEYEKSVEFINTDENAAEVIVKAGIVPKVPIAKAALPNSNIVFISGKEMQEKLSGFLEILHSYNPQSVGGKLPEKGFYYEK